MPMIISREHEGSVLRKPESTVRARAVRNYALTPSLKAPRRLEWDIGDVQKQGKHYLQNKKKTLH